MRKNQTERSSAMTAAGVLTTHWSLLARRVRELGGKPEDLYPLGSPEDPETIALTNAAAEKLVARGRALRATSAKDKAQFPLSIAVQLKLMPRHLFVIHKDGSDAPALRSRMDGTCFVSECAGGMLTQPEFVIGPSETTIIGVFDCGQLGVIGWLDPDFFGPKGWKHVGQFDLAKCRPDDAPYIRAAHLKQELNEWFGVAHDPISSGGYPRVFHVGHRSDNGPYLYSYNTDSDYRMTADNLVALRLAS